MLIKDGTVTHRYGRQLENGFTNDVNGSWGTVHNGEECCDSRICGDWAEVLGSGDLDHHPTTMPFLETSRLPPQATCTVQLSNNVAEWALANEVLEEPFELLLQDLLRLHELDCRTQLNTWTHHKRVAAMVTLIVHSWLYMTGVGAGLAQAGRVRNMRNSPGGTLPPELWRRLQSAQAAMDQAIRHAATGEAKPRTQNVATALQAKRSVLLEARAWRRRDRGQRYEQLCAEEPGSAERYLRAILEPGQTGLPDVMEIEPGVFTTNLGETLDHVAKYIEFRGTEVAHVDPRVRAEKSAEAIAVWERIYADIRERGPVGWEEYTSAEIDVALHRIQAKKKNSGLVYAAYKGLGPMGKEVVKWQQNWTTARAAMPRERLSGRMFQNLKDGKAPVHKKAFRDLTLSEVDSRTRE